MVYRAELMPLATFGYCPSNRRPSPNPCAVYRREPILFKKFGHFSSWRPLYWRRVRFAVGGSLYRRHVAIFHAIDTSPPRGSCCIQEGAHLKKAKFGHFFFSSRRFFPRGLLRFTEGASFVWGIWISFCNLAPALPLPSLIRLFLKRLSRDQT